jgi:hypothetical protein
VTAHRPLGTVDHNIQIELWRHWQTAMETGAIPVFRYCRGFR